MGQQHRLPLDAQPPLVAVAVRQRRVIEAGSLRYLTHASKELSDDASEICDRRYRKADSQPLSLGQIGNLQDRAPAAGGAWHVWISRSVAVGWAFARGHGERNCLRRAVSSGSRASSMRQATP